MRRKYSIVYFYVTREFLFSFVIAFSFFFIIFFINQILVMAEQIFSKHVPFKDVMLLIFYSMPIFVAFSFPFGSLVGALMAVGRLSSDNEILAFQASGISFSRLMVPFVVIGVLFSFISFVTNDYLLPSGNIKLTRLYTKILHTNPAIELEPYSIKNYDNTIIVTGNVTGKTIHDITLIDRGNGGEKRVIVAKDTTLLKDSEQRGVVSLRMNNVFLITTGNNRESYSYSIADQLIYNILLRNISVSIGGTGPAEMSSFDVWQVIKKKEKLLLKRKQQRAIEIEKLRVKLSNRIWELLNTQNYEDFVEKKRGIDTLFKSYQIKKNSKVRDRELQYYKSEFNKKFAIPIACLFFMIFAFPIGLLAKRSGRAVGFGIGLVVSFLYWSLLFLGQTFATRLYISPVLSIWMADMVVILFSVIFMFYRIRR